LKLKILTDGISVWLGSELDCIIVTRVGNISVTKCTGFWRKNEKQIDTNISEKLGMLLPGGDFVTVVTVHERTCPQQKAQVIATNMLALGMEL
jgi:hypothetical protein